MPVPIAHHARLAERVAIVTGAGSEETSVAAGIGEAIARLFAAEGAHVCVVDLDARRADNTVARIRSAGGVGMIGALPASERLNPPS